MLNPGREWEKWGKKDPYFAVLTNPEFRKQQLSVSAKEQFFASGERHVAVIMNRCRTCFGESFSPKRVLDYGCGVGRCAIPFARIAEHVCGIDVSDSMLAEAKANCERLRIGNVEFHNINEGLDQFTEGYHLLHSFIVFQHIPAAEGLRLLQRLTRLLADNSVCVLHLTFAKRTLSHRFGFPHLIDRLANRTLDGLYRLFRRLTCQASDPEMQMNCYNLSQVCCIIQTLGVPTVHMDFTDHDGELGVVLYFRKDAASRTKC